MQGGELIMENSISKKLNIDNESMRYCQTHVHEFLGSTKLAGKHNEIHNHRFAGVTSEAIPIPNGHVHSLLTNTDFADHFHEAGAVTSPAIPVSSDKHVHFVWGTTSTDDGHEHKFRFATLIESPIL